VRDNIERKAVQNASAEGRPVDEASRHSEERLALVLQAADLGFWDWDIRTDRLEWSERCLAMFGLPAETSMNYAAFLQAVHPDDRERVDRAVRDALEHHSDYQIEMRTLWPDGTVRWVHSRGRAYYNDDGQPMHMSGIVLDISERRQAEAGVRAREQEFRTLADSLPQLIWVLDATLRLEYCSQEFYRFTGLSPDEVFKVPWPETRKRVMHPEDLASTLHKTGQSMQSASEYVNEARVRRYDGQYRTFLTRAVPLLDDDGQVTRWIGSSTDIHDQKLAEEAMRRSEKLAVTGRLATSIAHEINNPLMALTGLLYLVQHDPSLSENSRRLLQTAEEELARVAHIVTQTLRFNRSSKSAAEADLREVTDSVLALFIARLTGAGIVLQRQYEDVAPLFCHADEIRQMLANFIANAHDAMGRGGKLTLRIACGLSWTEAGRRGLRITIADNGAGIPDALRERIFEPFFTTKESTGTGLGLWVSSEIVRRHGGTIHFRSSTVPERSGTVFSIFLPSDGAAEMAQSASG
jgi:PAS domain S-box-containing protein